MLEHFRQLSSSSPLLSDQQPAEASEPGLLCGGAPKAVLRPGPRRSVIGRQPEKLRLLQGACWPGGQVSLARVDCDWAPYCSCSLRAAYRWQLAGLPAWAACATCRSSGWGPCMRVLRKYTCCVYFTDRVSLRQRPWHGQQGGASWPLVRAPSAIHADLAVCDWLHCRIPNPSISVGPSLLAPLHELQKGISRRTSPGPPLL